MRVLVLVWGYWSNSGEKQIVHCSQWHIDTLTQSVMRSSLLALQRCHKKCYKLWIHEAVTQQSIPVSRDAHYSLFNKTHLLYLWSISCSVSLQWTVINVEYDRSLCLLFHSHTTSMCHCKWAPIICYPHDMSMFLCGTVHQNIFVTIIHESVHYAPLEVLCRCVGLSFKWLFEVACCGNSHSSSCQEKSERLVWLLKHCGLNKLSFKQRAPGASCLHSNNGPVIVWQKWWVYIVTVSSTAFHTFTFTLRCNMRYVNDCLLPHVKCLKDLLSETENNIYNYIFSSVRSPVNKNCSVCVTLEWAFYLKKVKEGLLVATGWSTLSVE